MIGQIDRQELAEKIRHNERFYLVEALPENYYERSHIPGALNIPAESVRELAPKFLRDKKAEIVTYCMNAT
jgi:rhodanese-related sulfurtransferase